MVNQSVSTVVLATIDFQCWRAKQQQHLAGRRPPPQSGRSRGQHEAAHTDGGEDCAAVAAGRRSEACGRLGDDALGAVEFVGDAAESTAKSATGAGDFQSCADDGAAGGQFDEACALNVRRRRGAIG